MVGFKIFLIKALSRAVISLPRLVQLRIGDVLGLIWFYVVRIRRNHVMESLRLCFPHLNEKEIFSLARKNYLNYGRGLVEFLWLPIFNEKYFKKYCQVEGLEHFQNAVKPDCGVFFLALHMGAWELMSASARLMGISGHVITKKFSNSGLNEVWVRLREEKGIKLIEGEKSTFQILRAIRGGDSIGFILDQYMGPPIGTKVNFFGRPTGAPASLALFADRTRAPVVPGYSVRTHDGHLRFIFEEPIPFMEQGSREKNISFMTQVYTNKIEEIVRRYPEQWMWLHRRWKPFNDH